MTATAPLPPVSWRVDTKVAAAWALAGGLSTIALMPYLIQLMPDKFAHLPVPLPLVIALQGVQATVVFGLMALLGLRMGHRVALSSPLLQRWFGGKGAAGVRDARPVQSILIGLAVSAVVLALTRLIDPMLPAMVHPPAMASAADSALNGLLASFYGGIGEELQLRLLLMTLLVWTVAKLRKSAPGDGVYWMAIMIAALLFGAGHLPAAHHVWGLDAVVVTRTLLLNGLAGVVFGWLYWKRGLEMAVLAHFCADIALHAVPPLLHLQMP